MKPFLRTFLIVFMVIGAAACGNKKKTGARFEERGARAQEANVSAQAVEPRSKVIATPNTSYNTWINVVKRLVSASIPENYLVGSVSPTNNGSTGVFMAARLCLQQGQAQQITNRALVVLHVYDEYRIPVPIYLNATSGAFNGSRVVAQFADSFGSIRIDAQVVGQNVQGYVSFNTLQKHDGTRDNRGEWTLGEFYMSAQELFSCY